MALTEKKRRFVAARQSGASNRDAALAAGYSEKTASQAGSRLAKDKVVLAHMARQQAVKATHTVSQQESIAIQAQKHADPQAFLLAVMNDEGEEMRLRMDAAKALMPYLHARKGDVGKKQVKQEAAKQITSRFAPSAPPAYMMN